MTDPRAHVRVAADVGGTFIDFVAADAAPGEVRFEKQPAGSGAIVTEFMAALDRMSLGGTEITQLFHGTTVVQWVNTSFPWHTCRVQGVFTR